MVGETGKTGGFAGLGRSGAPVSLPQARLRSSIGRGNTEYSLLAWVPDLGQGVLGHPCQH
ncbi:hypothetical protein ARTHRO8AJ_450006 [Arthrobacter sp. 8AJ]|nr:hypothetical protein ARTHRO8AJ_450006 [Arthrobacter sp. 8AJ]